MAKHLARKCFIAALTFLFPKWMERMKEEVLEEEFYKAVLPQIEAQVGGLGKRLDPPYS